MLPLTCRSAATGINDPSPAQLIAACLTRSLTAGEPAFDDALLYAKDSFNHLCIVFLLARSDLVEFLQDSSPRSKVCSGQDETRYTPEERKALVMNITHLSLVSVPVADQQVAKTFYTETLGFTVVRDLVESAQRWVELAPNGKAATITLVTWFPEMSPGSLQGLVFDTDNIVEAYEELSERGVEIFPIESDPFGRYARFKDPDGNGLVLRQQSLAA